MDPINYMLDVRNPIEEAIRGYTMGRNDIAQQQDMQIQRQNATMQQQAFADQQSALQAQRAAADKAVADAQAGQAELARIAGLGSAATPDDYMKAWVANPAIRDDLNNLKTMITEPQSAALLQTTQNMYATTASGNVDATRSILQTQLDAAMNSGDQQMVPAYRAALDQLNQDPEGAMAQLKTTSAMTLMGLKGPEYIKTINESLGLTPAKTPEGFQTLQLRAKAAGLVPGTPEYNQFMVSGGKPQEGISFTTNPDGTTTFTQGSGVGGVDVRKPGQNYVYGTDASGRQVAQPIAGTPEALQVTETSGRLDGAIAVGENMLSTIESIVGRPAGNGLTAIKPNPALAGIVGLIDGRLPAKTQAQADLLAKYEQIQGQAFLEAFSILKGAGAITEQEGIKATQAYARTQRTQSPEAFTASMNEFADIVRLGMKRAQDQKMALPQIAPSTAEGSGLPQSFLSDQSAIDAARNAGVTLQDMWDIMTPENKARYGK
jgi:hypothetical protein